MINLTEYPCYFLCSDCLEIHSMGMSTVDLRGLNQTEKDKVLIDSYFFNNNSVGKMISKLKCPYCKKMNINECTKMVREYHCKREIEE